MTVGSVVKNNHSYMWMSEHRGYFVSAIRRRLSRDEALVIDDFNKALWVDIRYLELVIL